MTARVRVRGFSNPPGRNGAIGIGIAIWESEGKLLFDGGKPLEKKGTNIEAELYALDWGVDKAIDFGLTDVILETNTEFISSLFSGGNTKIIRLLKIYRHIRSKLRNFKSWKVIWVRSDPNTIAHSHALESVKKAEELYGRLSRSSDEKQKTLF